jgi:hypothetical protein
MLHLLRVSVKLESLDALSIKTTAAVFSPNTKSDLRETISKQKQTWSSVKMNQTMMVSQSCCRFSTKKLRG